MKKRALICGVSGQDGAYLSRFLLDRDYEVFGASRDAQTSTFGNLKRLGVRDKVSTLSVEVSDFRSVFQALVSVKPDEVYNLAGQSSVRLSFDQPVETMESVSIATLNILEAIRFTGDPIRFYNAGSSECFGATMEPANESTPFRPRSPYGVAKSAAYWQVANYREAYELYACTGILFNHESPLRPERFVTRKIISAACRIKGGSHERLSLGNIDIERDWGWAPEYIEAMWLMLQRSAPEDFVIATGASYTLAQFIEAAFSALGLDWSEHVETDARLLRPTDFSVSKADPAKAEQVLGWKARSKMPDIVQRMVQAELALNQGQRLLA